MEKIDFTPEQWAAHREHLRVLNQMPDPAKLKKHPHQGFEYLPTSYIEAKLTEIFGLWELVDIKFEAPIVNEIIVTGKLRVYLRHLGIMQEYSGTAAILIQTQSGKPIMPENKISTTLEKMAPKGATEVLKNAAKKLGNLFGANLRRATDAVTNYSPVNAANVDFKNNKQVFVDAVKNQLLLIDDLDSSRAFFRSLDVQHQADKEIVSLFVEHKDKITLQLPPANEKK